MRLPLRKTRSVIYIVGALVAVLFFLSLSRTTPNTSAEASRDDFSQSDTQSEYHFVTFYDQGNKLTIKTDAITVREALERADITFSDTDTIEPDLTEQITSDNFNINIYRSRPVLVIDGTTKKLINTSSYDGKTIAQDADLTLYDGDEINLAKNENFLETGDVATYEITRNGGRTITVETVIPYEEEEVKDASLASGKTEERQAGEEGRSVAVYKVNFVDGVEVSRELVSEEVVKEPVNKITAVGTKSSIRPEWKTCSKWATEAGVSEDDLYSALTLIYHESGCRVSATNSSSGAYGIPQALPGSKMASEGSDWETNPVTQIKWMAKYVKRRYGGWTQALTFWQNNHWY